MRLVEHPMAHENPASFAFRFTQQETGNPKPETLFSEQKAGNLFMKNISRVFLILFLISEIGFAGSSADSLEILRRDLDKMFSDARFANAQWGVEVFSLDRSEMLYDNNSLQLYIPASNNKILTVAAALTQLGPDYRFKTQVWTDGTVFGGILKGDLIVAGFGDPSSSFRIASKDPFRTFRIWAANLKQKGIHAIDGNILGDGTSFKETAYGQGWAWDDLAEGYAAPVSALQFNENLISLEIAPGSKAGEFASIRMSPLAQYMAVDNRIVMEAAGKSARIELERSRSGEGITIRGILSEKSSRIDRSVAVQFPIRYYLSALKQVLGEEGIDVSRCDIEELKNIRSQSSNLLWTQTSPPLSEILGPMLKMSLNLATETLARVLGMERRGEGSFSKGKEVVEEVLEQMGVVKESYSYSDASGLSRMNLVSADALIRTLKHLYRSPYFSIFYDALPIAGVDGTLSARMKGTQAENNVHAKTGTLTHISALSGYVRTADKEMLAFSMIANNFLVEKNEAEHIQDNVLVRLARFSRKAVRSK
jgi:serine-type D-Ala-D-Ala carboxypeptidase/endopeptidase (penicillin-binding protein 4)